MKPDDWIGDLAKGEWWLPTTPDTRVPGIIVLRNERLQLQLIGTFDENEHSFSHKRYPIICGWLNSGGPVSLFGCSSSSSFSAPGMMTEQCSFSRVIKGHNFSDVAEARFTSLDAHLANLMPWLGTYGLDLSFSLTDSRLSEWKALYHPVEPLDFALDGGRRLRIHFTVKFPSMRNRTTVSIIQDCSVEVKSETAEELSKLHEAIYCFELFVELLSGLEIVTTLDGCASSLVLDESGTPKRLLVMMNRGASTRIPVEPENWFDMLVPYQEVRDRLQACLTSWLEVYGQYGAVVPASLSDRRDQPPEMQFLLLANAIHRYAETASPSSRIDFAQAIQQILPKYCEPHVFKEIETLLKDSRHYYTHFNPALAEKTARGADLMNLIDLLDMVNRFFLLESIGFSIDELKAWAAKSWTFGERLSMRRWSNI